MPKFYVVFKGRSPGIYGSWDECRKQTEGFRNPKFGSYKTRSEAEAALASGSAKNYKEEKASKQRDLWRSKVGACLAVDAACAGVPGPTEFRGVMLPECSEIFRAGSFLRGTNNIGEYLAIVRAMQWLEERSIYHMLIFSDSMVGIGWVKNRRCNTHLEAISPDLQLEVDQADHWLGSNPNVAKLTTLLRKWPTSEWGEIPADYGRK